MSYNYQYDPTERANVIMMRNICREYTDDELAKLGVDPTFKAVRELCNYITHLEQLVDNLEDQVDFYAR